MLKQAEFIPRTNGGRYSRLFFRHKSMHIYSDRLGDKSENIVRVSKLKPPGLNIYCVIYNNIVV